MGIADWAMTQTVTLRRPTGETQDSIGEATLTYEALQTTMYLEPRSGQEEAVERNTPIGDWLGVGRADVDFTSWSQIVYGAHIFDIIAPPRLMPDPFLNVPSHWEIDLQEVT